MTHHSDTALFKPPRTGRGPGGFPLLVRVSILAVLLALSSTAAASGVDVHAGVLETTTECAGPSETWSYSYGWHDPYTNDSGDGGYSYRIYNETCASSSNLVEASVDVDDQRLLAAEAGERSTSDHAGEESASWWNKTTCAGAPCNESSSWEWRSDHWSGTSGRGARAEALGEDASIDTHRCSSSGFGVYDGNANQSYSGEYADSSCAGGLFVGSPAGEEGAQLWTCHSSAYTGEYGGAYGSSSYDEAWSYCYLEQEERQGVNGTSTALDGAYVEARGGYGEWSRHACTEDGPDNSTCYWNENSAFVFAGANVFVPGVGTISLAPREDVPYFALLA